MTDRRIRWEVERWDSDGLRTSYALTVDPPEMDDATAQRVHEIIDRAVEDARRLGIPDPAATLAALLLTQVAEDRAYQRVAERRGVLPL